MTDQISESVSSFASIACRATPEQWRKMLAMNWSAAAEHAASLQSGAADFLDLTKTLGSVIRPAPGTSAGLTAGIVRPRCGCGGPNDRWKPNAKNPARSCSRCNRESVAKYRDAKRREQAQRDQELNALRAELARLKQPAE